MTSDAKRLREQAERCLRLSKEALPDDPVRSLLRSLAAESLEKAQALERAADQQQQQVENVVPLPEPIDDSVQQQQQVQPDKPKNSE